MRRGLHDWEDFYAGPWGRIAQDAVARRLRAAWGDARSLSVLGLGYALPWLEGFDAARRVTAAAPAAQGARAWPDPAPNRIALVDEAALPFADGAFDRVLVVHALEEAAAPDALLAEAARALASSGRIMVVAAASFSPWTFARSTPLGFGRSFGAVGLGRAMLRAGLEPSLRWRALHAPPWRALAGQSQRLERLGPWLWPAFAGLVGVEATRRDPARPGVVRAAPVRDMGLIPTLTPALNPAAACGPAFRRDGPAVRPVLRNAPPSAYVDRPVLATPRP